MTEYWKKIYTCNYLVCNISNDRDDDSNQNSIIIIIFSNCNKFQGVQGQKLIRHLPDLQYLTEINQWRQRLTRDD